MQLSKDARASLEDGAAKEGNTGEAWLKAAMTTGQFNFEVNRSLREGA